MRTLSTIVVDFSCFLASQFRGRELRKVLLYDCNSKVLILSRALNIGFYIGLARSVSAIPWYPYCRCFTDLFPDLD